MERPRVQVLIIVLLQLIWALKLLLTFVLLSQFVGHLLLAPSSAFYRVASLILLLPVLLHVFILLGLTKHRDWAHRWAVKMSIAGCTVGVLCCLLTPFAAIVSIVVLLVGLVLTFINSIA